MLFENRFVNYQARKIFRTVIMTIIIFSFFLSCNYLFASQAKIVFNPSVDSRVVGYKIYYGMSTHISNIIDIGNKNSYVVSNLQEGATYFFAATAYDRYGNESGFSEVLPYDVPKSGSPGRSYGMLGGSVDSPPASLDLAREGLADWVHWGLNNAACVNRKGGITQKIGNFTLIGNSNPYRFTDARVAFSWIDGSPTSRGTRTTAGIFFKGIGNGYQIRVPAGTSTNTLKIYLGAWKAKGQFEAFLTDGSSAPFIVDVGNPTGIIDRVITLKYAASGEADLIIKYTLENSYAGWGNITLMAVTL